MKKINLKYSDRDWDFDFITLFKNAISAAENEGAISTKQADWLLKTSNELVNFYNVKSS